MLVEFGNHCKTTPNAFDDRPKVTTVNIPEPDSKGLGGFTHVPGLAVEDFIEHVQDAILNKNRVWHLPDHEILLALTQEAWPAHSGAQQLGRVYVDGKHQEFQPAWVRVRSHEEVYGSEVEKPEDGNTVQPHNKDAAADLENFLREYYRLPDNATKPADLEEKYWTKWGPPGDGPKLPDVTNTFLNDGRTQQGVNYGGGQLGAVGTGTAATATSLTTASTFTTNQWTGYRVYVMQTASGPIVWGNVVSNTNAAGASVLTVDRWYNAATPGGAAASTPSGGYQFILADGGTVSAWFVGLTTTNITPAATDHTMTGEYTTTGGGMIRKIAPYALTSGTSPMTYTLTPVYTANTNDTFPSTFYAIGVFVSMVVGTNPAMKFETTMNAAATINTSGDQITVTETVTGS